MTSATVVAEGARCRVGRRVSAPLDLRIDGPGTHAVVGPNGAGKTTWLSVLAGRVALRSGTVSVAGRSLAAARLTGEVLVVDTARVPSVEIGFAAWARARGPLVGATPESFAAAADHWDVGAYVDEPPHAMSTGMRARCLLALAFASTATVIALDEPERGLDALALELLRAEMTAAEGNGRSILVATHDAATLAAATTTTAIGWLQR